LIVPIFEPRKVHSVATHNSDSTAHLKYPLTAQYLDNVSLWSPVSYSLSVALSVGAADCYYRDSSHRRQCLFEFSCCK